MIKIQYGKVFLVGAGPGDPDLITVKAHRLLQKCDAVVYDSLVPSQILEVVRASCELQFVGKRRGHHSSSQVKTNSLLLELAKKHDCVVRLKGGDPFMFGRGGEEAEYLFQKGVPVEVVPGVTAGIAAPAYIGIPLTHRLCGSSVTFVTGHEEIDKARRTVNWSSLAEVSHTLVIYMGLHNIEQIVQQLIEGGMGLDTPAAVIQQATVVGQRFIRANLGDLVQESRRKMFSSPSIIVIGKIVDLQVKECSPEPANVTMPITF
ncbi:uroporphyrinogen-III C-methyltransferase [Prochlorococcus sp. MIT 1341]|uniref:uroporphyrinogen-III C-methyltransferase n=1 Tax=Prochlorococcus sp. MIT 1341 TaxID=3096221 RepID=UPI002A7472EF|nr:uroporphyrinogen-III C-methyltransferase [Prochlorococcus sp. MIT 1341]